MSKILYLLNQIQLNGYKLLAWWHLDLDGAGKNTELYKGVNRVADLVIIPLLAITTIWALISLVWAVLIWGIKIKKVESGEEQAKYKQKMIRIVVGGLISLTASALIPFIGGLIIRTVIGFN